MDLLTEHRLFEGTQKRFKHLSKKTGTQMMFSIFLPDVCEEGKRLPVLYWLSGLTCTDENFMTKAGAQRVASELGLILVTPDTSPRGEGVPDDENGAYDLGLGAGFYVNATEAPWAKHYQMYDYITKELPELIQTHFPVTDKKAISGHSMGGHGAIMIGLNNPLEYTSLSAFSPILNPSATPWGEKAFKAYLGENKKSWQSYDSTALIQAINNENHLPILIHQGDKDEFLQKELGHDAFLKSAERSTFPIDYHLEKGYDHSYFFIATFIEAHLRFHYKALCA